MRPIALLSATLLLTLPLAAQAPAPQEPAPQKPAPTDTVLQTGTQLVYVDVVVQDKDGHPIHGLKASNFKLTEDKNPVSIHSFDEHTPAPTPTGMPPMPKFPPGTFTNYTPVPPSGTLNILLLDALNTPMKDQAFVRNQLQEYVRHAPAGTHIAIFGLNSRLYILQGFTSDPDTLKNAIDKKLTPRASNLLDDPVGGTTPDAVSDQLGDLGASADLVANLAQFEAQDAAFQTQLRLDYTLDAFNTLGHYLAAFPGRKNLIWFSGSFPIDILPDPSLASPFMVAQTNDAEFRETMNLLTKAQVAVYPIDARGLMTQPMYDASNAGRGYARNSAKFGNDLNKFNSAQAQEHSTMQQVADDTGGHAFYNTNGISAAVASAIDSGSSYYTLTYSPPNRKWDGSYRSIRLNLVDTPANLVTSYRRGYYADDPDHLKKNHVAASVPASSTSATTSSTNPHHAVDYVGASMSRGAPTPQDILIKVRVLPAVAGTEPTVAPGNELNPKEPTKGPFQRFAVDFVSLPTEISLPKGPDGNRTASLEYLAYLFDADGKFLNADGRTINLTITPAQYDRFIHSALEMHLEISAPLKPATFLRIGLHDVTSNRMGVIEVPIASISRLPPPTPPSTPSTPAPASPAPPTTTAPTPPAPH